MHVSSLLCESTAMIAVPPFPARRLREEGADCVNRVNQIWNKHKGPPETITKRLRLPLIAAPMLSVSGPELVIAACRNGVIGAFPVANARTVEGVTIWLQQIEDAFKVAVSHAQWQWHTGYCARAEGRSEYSDPRIKKKAGALSPVNKVVMEGCCPDAVTVEVRRVEAAEVDEMWSFVGSKAHQRWLWQAIDHLTGVVLAYVFGSRADEVFVELKKLLKPFGLV